MQSLTISRKISIGFTALILITGALGGLAVSSMRTVQKSARTLSQVYVPEVDTATSLQRDLSAARLAIRSYGLTGEQAYVQEARQHLVAVQEDLKRAQKLADDHPALAKLRTELGNITTTLKAFTTAIDATEARNHEIAGSRKKMDAAAAEFATAIDHLIEGQTEKLQHEIKIGDEPNQLLLRLRKVILAEDIRGLGNSARVAAFKAQALRDPALFQQSLTTFDKVDALLAELLGLLKVKADIDELNIVKKDALAYRDALRSVMNDSVALAEIGAKRTEAAAAVLHSADAMSNDGMKRTIEAVDSSEKRLSISSTTIFIGIAVALATGFAIAFVIIRGTTKVLLNVAEGLNETSTQVTAAASQVAASSQTLAEGATEQAASLEETSASLEEMASMTKRNADSAQQAKQLSAMTRTSADAGATHMQEMRQAMDAIKASSDDIAKIIKTIDEIAFQTNILALNAAVEAARAGEAGAGFAVVADEVRSLAQRSAQSAKETAAKIEDAINKSEHGVIISGKVASALSEIVEKARSMDALVAEIATASAEQSQGITQVNTAVSQMDKVTQSNTSSAEESAAAAEELNAQAAAMQQAVGELRRLVTHKNNETSSAPLEMPSHAPARESLDHSNGSNGKLVMPPPPRRQSKLVFKPALATPGVNGHSDHFRD